MSAPASHNKTFLIFIPLIIMLTGVAIFANLQKSDSKETNPTTNASQGSSMVMNHQMPDGTMMGGMDHDGMDALVTDDKSFLQNMIPHHQEAVDTSKIILDKSSGDKELQMFAASVIETQTREIDEMKVWHKDWFGQEYKDDEKYKAMMSDLGSLSGVELDKTYTKGMIEHHKGAIAMAKKIEKITQRTELKEMAKSIMIAQDSEIEILNNWLVSKYDE